MIPKKDMRRHTQNAFYAGEKPLINERHVENVVIERLNSHYPKWMEFGEGHKHVAHVEHEWRKGRVNTVADAHAALHEHIGRDAKEYGYKK